MHVTLSVYLHSKNWLVDLTNIWSYKLHDVNCLQNVRTNNDFFKEIKTFSFDKQSFHSTIVSRQFTFRSLVNNVTLSCTLPGASLQKMELFNFPKAGLMIVSVI